MKNLRRLWLCGGLLLLWMGNSTVTWGDGSLPGDEKQTCMTTCRDSGAMPDLDHGNQKMICSKCCDQFEKNSDHAGVCAASANTWLWGNDLSYSKIRLDPSKEDEPNKLWTMCESPAGEKKCKYTGGDTVK